MISAKLTSKMRYEVYKRDGFRCALCDNPRGLQIHHYVHRSQGGINHPMNLITVCWTCHAQLHGTHIDGYDFITQDDMEQACAEYLGDYYAPDWYPYDG